MLMRAKLLAKLLILLAAACLQAGGTQKAQKIEWTDDPAKMVIPDAPLTGQVLGKEFKPTFIHYNTFLRQVVFAQSSGGMLTDKQIDVITSAIRSRWSQRGILDGANPPSYAPKSTGDAQRGEAAYKTYCESCHGPAGRGGQKGSAITDDSFLALVSDQGLRTIVIAGRPELGAPDWRGNSPGKPMSDQEITDVVAWLASRRVQNPGQPYATSNYTQH